MTEHDPSGWLAFVADIFDGLGVEWTLIGALAANRYRATPRFTMDVDTLSAWDDALISALEEVGYAVEVVADQGETPHLLRCHRGAEALDVLVASIEYQWVALDRAIDRVLSVEDVIIHKLIAWRPRDRDDIRSILEAGSELDLEYLDHWVGEWDVGDRWSEFDHDA